MSLACSRHVGAALGLTSTLCLLSQLHPPVRQRLHVQTFMDGGVALGAGQEAEGAAALGAVASGDNSQTRFCSKYC